MAYSIVGTSITLTRGDTLEVLVEIEGYELQQGDSLRFAVKKNIYKGTNYTELTDKDPLILKDIPTDTCLLKLDPEDTKDLPFGTYVYDVELTMADGTVDTFIRNAKFKLTVEVH